MFALSLTFKKAIFASAVALVLALYFGASAPGQQNWDPQRKGSYGKITRSALDRLLAAAQKLQSGDRAAAGPLLQGMHGDIAELSRATAFFREQANREFDRCTVQIGGLDTRVADLYQQEMQLKMKIQDLEAQLAGMNEQTKLTQGQIQKLNESVAATQGKLADRQAKLKELEQWWWVPFYGQYLAVRTLVDDDIGNYKSLVNSVRDFGVQLQQNQNALRKTSELKAALSKEISQIQNTQNALNEMRTGAESDLADLKGSAVFLTDAQVFWALVDRLVSQNVTQSVTAAADIGKLRTQLMKESWTPPFSARKARHLTEVYDSLVEFADTLDQGNNFLMAEGSQFCGGPPRSKTGPAVSAKCNIEQFTKYYEIVDPKTCAFRYLNPPGCPPRPKPVTVTDQSIAAARQRGSWERAPDQNWIGRARCSSPLVKYFGKVNSSQACERVCMSAGACTFWTFNVQNASMGGDSRNECWGASTGLTPNKSSWSGFESGGVSGK